jgi:hypothetical protein
MEQSPFREANSPSASQEIPRILWNPKCQYRIHKRPPSIPILSQINPIHASPLHLLEIHFNIILPSTLRSSKWFLSTRSAPSNPCMHLSLSPYVLHVSPCYCFDSITVMSGDYRSLYYPLSFVPGRWHAGTTPFPISHTHFTKSYWA